MAKKQFDFVIVGGGMSGCLMAKALDLMESAAMKFLFCRSTRQRTAPWILSKA
jgi:cation diffusion facilitator CzcD-associated flavoprotein CzcO